MNAFETEKRVVRMQVWPVEKRKIYSNFGIDELNENKRNKKCERLFRSEKDTGNAE